MFYGATSCNYTINIVLELWRISFLLTSLSPLPSLEHCFVTFVCNFTYYPISFSCHFNWAVAVAIWMVLFGPGLYFIIILVIIHVQSYVTQKINFTLFSAVKSIYNNYVPWFGFLALPNSIIL